MTQLRIAICETALTNFWAQWPHTPSHELPTEAYVQLRRLLAYYWAALDTEAQEQLAAKG